MKRKIICFLLIMIVVGAGCFACSKEDEEPETIETVYERNITVSEDGTYFLFYTNLEQEYVDFLEMMDQEKNEKYCIMNQNEYKLGRKIV